MIAALMPMLILLGAISAIIFYNARETALTNTKAEFENSLISFNNIAEECYNKYTLLISNIYVNLFLNAPQMKNWTEMQQSANAQINYLMMNIKELSPYVERINLYGVSSEYVLSTYGSDERRWFYDKSWIEEYERSGREYFMMLGENERLVFVFSIKQKDKLRGLIAITTDLNKLKERVDLFSSPTKIDFYNSIQKEYLMGSGNEFINITSDDFRVIKNNTIYCGSYVSIPDMMLVSETPVGKFEYNNIFVIISVVCVFMSLLFTVILSYYISNNFYASIAKVTAQFRHVLRDEDDLESAGESEWKYISKSLMRLVEKNDSIENELLDKITSLKVYQTIMLQNQFNPHFLFNSLNAVNSILINCCSDERPSEIISGICSLMLAAYDTKTYIVSMEDEIDYIRTYIEIEEIKNNYSFDVEYDIDSSLYDCRVMKFILQPVVENAVFHGIKRLPKEERGNISISVKREGKAISIYVSDNGPGMDNDVLEALWERINQDDILNERHIGLCNVNNRLKLFYGENYGIKDINSDSCGTAVHIVLPEVRD